MHINKSSKRSLTLVAGIGALVVPVGGAAATVVTASSAQAAEVGARTISTYDGSLVTVTEMVNGKLDNYGKLQVRITVDSTDPNRLASVSWPIYPGNSAAKAQYAVAVRNQSAATAAVAKAKAAVKKAKKSKSKADDKKAAAALKKANAGLAVAKVRAVKAKADLTFHTSSQTISEIFLPMMGDEAVTGQVVEIGSVSGASATHDAFVQSLQAAITTAGITLTPTPVGP